MLQGWQRSWNVGSDRRSHPERIVLDPSGVAFEGTMAVLGISTRPGAECTGAVLQVTDDDLRRLAVRERNYALADVTGSVLRGRPRPDDDPADDAVVTYEPTPVALDRLVDAEEAGTAVIRSAYEDLVAAAFRELGPAQYQDYLRTTLPSALPRLDLNLRTPTLP